MHHEEYAGSRRAFKRQSRPDVGQAPLGTTPGGASERGTA
jgi:hypothetical protein